MSDPSTKENERLAAHPPGANGRLLGEENPRRSPDQTRQAVDAAERLYVLACEKLQLYDEKAHASRIARAEKIKAALGASALGAQPVDVMTMNDALGMLAWGVEQLSQRLVALERRNAELEQHIGTVEAKKAPLAVRIAELEQRPGLTYQGVWAAEKVYSVGDFVTHGGSLWHAWDGNLNVKPGSSETWQLAVQRGKDGRDVRGNR